MKITLTYQSNVGLVRHFDLFSVDKALEVLENHHSLGQLCGVVFDFLGESIFESKDYGRFIVALIATDNMRGYTFLPPDFYVNVEVDPRYSYQATLILKPLREYLEYRKDKIVTIRAPTVQPIPTVNLSPVIIDGTTTIHTITNTATEIITGETMTTQLTGFFQTYYSTLANGTGSGNF